jgi:hypothetical protein
VPLIRSLIETTPELRDLSNEVRHLLAAEAELRGALPDALKMTASVASIAKGRLLLLAQDPAAAAKLRHLLPSLLRAVKRAAPEVTAMDLRVQVRDYPKSLPRKQNLITPEARAAFAALASRLPPSPLKTALGRIAKTRQT